MCACVASSRYCIIQFEGYEKRTQVVDNNLNPVWNEAFLFRVQDYFSESAVEIELFDKVRGHAVCAMARVVHAGDDVLGPAVVEILARRSLK